MNRYAIALGSNQGHGRARTPGAMIQRAIAALTAAGILVERFGRVIDTAPLGPSRRRYANSAALIQSDLNPEALLETLKAIERQLGRRAGQRWGARTIDIDIILWSGGRRQSRALTIPHPRWRERGFVLYPLVDIAPDWRDPASGHSLRQITHRYHASRNRPKRH